MQLTRKEAEARFNEDLDKTHDWYVIFYFKVRPSKIFKTCLPDAYDIWFKNWAELEGIELK